MSTLLNDGILRSQALLKQQVAQYELRVSTLNDLKIELTEAMARSKSKYNLVMDSSNTDVSISYNMYSDHNEHFMRTVLFGVNAKGWYKYEWGDAEKFQYGNVCEVVDVLISIKELRSLFPQLDV